MKSIPKKAKYMRACLKEFWKFKLKPSQNPKNMEHIGSAPLWRNHVFKVDIRSLHMKTGQLLRLRPLGGPTTLPSAPNGTPVTAPTRVDFLVTLVDGY